MKALYIGSTEPFSGKTLITLGLGKHLVDKGGKIGYFKTLCKLPYKTKEGVFTDRSSYFIHQSLGLSEDVSLLCSVLWNYELKVRALRGEIKTLMPQVKKTFEAVSKGKDTALIGGAEDIWAGAFLGISGIEVAKELGAKVLIVGKYKGELLLDSVVEIQKSLGDELIGVIINQVAEEQKGDVEDLVIPWMKSRGIRVFGWIPYDPFLKAVTASELKESLGGRIVTGKENLNQFVMNYLIGGMEVDKFAEYLRRTPDAAVIVGGDRADIQLVSIEEGAKCLLLTGNFTPNEIIISKAEQKGVPIIILREDTYFVSQRVQEIRSRLSFKEKEKVERGLELIRSNVDFDSLAGSL